MKRNLVLLLFTLMVISVSVAQKRKGAQITIPKVDVVDYPTIEWLNYPTDTTTVAHNIQTLSCQVKSRLPLKRIEILVNGLSSDVYTSSDFSAAIGQNKYQQIIERTLTLRTGANIIQFIAENTKQVPALLT